MPYRQLGSYSQRKTSFDVFSLSREQVWTFSVLGDRIYEMRCLFVAVGLNALYIVLPHWDNMSPSHTILTPGRPVMFCGPHFIISTMQAGTTPIFKVFGMTGPSTNQESNPQILLVSAGSPLSSNQQGLLRTYLSPGSSIRSPHPGSPRGPLLRWVQSSSVARP